MPSPLVSHYRSAAKHSKDRSPSRIGSRKWRISSKYPLLRVSLSLVLSSPRRRSRGVSRFLSDSSEENVRTIIRYLTDHSRFSLGWSTPVKVTGGSKPRLISSQCPRWVRRPTTTTTSSSFVLLLSLVHARIFIIDRSIGYPIIPPSPRLNQYRNRLLETRPRTTPSFTFLRLPSFVKNMKKQRIVRNIFRDTVTSLHFIRFANGFLSLHSCPRDNPSTHVPRDTSSSSLPSVSNKTIITTELSSNEERSRRRRIWLIR